jgi:hypothetical protein
VEGKSAKGTGMFQNELNLSAFEQHAGAHKGTRAPAFYCPGDEPMSSAFATACIHYQ